MKPDFKNPPSIIVVQIGKIGDMILSTPLFSELKKLFPDSRLTILSSEINKDIPLNHSSVDKVIIFKKNIFRRIFLLKHMFLKTDIWIDTKDNYSKTSGLLFKIFRPVFSLGFKFPENKINYNVYLNEYAAGKHAVDLNLSPLNYFIDSNVKIKTLPSYNIPFNIKNKFERKFSTGKDKLNILINISAGSKSRYLHEKTWTEIIDHLSGNKKLQFILNGIEQDKKIINYILENTKSKKVKYLPAQNILETSEIVRNSDLIITPDTSVVHICSAFSKPVVAIYPDVKWNLEKFSPLSEKKVIVVSEDENSVNNVKAETIITAANKLLEEIIQEKISGNAESRTRVRKEDH